MADIMLTVYGISLRGYSLRLNSILFAVFGPVKAYCATYSLHSSAV